MPGKCGFLFLPYFGSWLLDTNRQARLTLRPSTRLRGDFGRLGGLLKLWLVDVPGQGVPESEVRAALDTILTKQGELSNLIVAIEKATCD